MNKKLQCKISNINIFIDTKNNDWLWFNEKIYNVKEFQIMGNAVIHIS